MAGARQSFAGTRVLVTGGTSGIGRATVLAFAENGADVVTCHRDDNPAAGELAAELAAIGGKHQVIRADVTVAEDVARLITACEQALGGLDVVVNNVGVDRRMPFADLAEDEWRWMFEHNVTAAYLVTRAALRLLADGGSVISIGSSAALRGRANGAHYTASKAALIGFTRGLCKDLGPQGIRVNAVAPGLTRTAAMQLPERAVERIVGQTALGRIGEPEDVAGAVLFLAGNDSRYITGVTLPVDGGV
jgi:3-oxoacyl-[acyl-carrier protein] reductase